MRTITDEEMQAALGQAKGYTLLLLKAGPRRRDPGVDAIIREHARRNLQLRDAGVLRIVCPVGGEVLAGVGVFDASVEAVDALMKDDPAVKEGVLVYELHRCRSFPGDALA
jgi:hypothetical protein